MSELEIRQYIENTKMGRGAEKYNLRTNEMEVFMELIDQNVSGTIYLAFCYGRAKGWRAAIKKGA